jgi:hypothetical protein
MGDHEASALITGELSNIHLTLDDTCGIINSSLSSISWLANMAVGAATSTVNRVLSADYGSLSAYSIDWLRIFEGHSSSIVRVVVQLGGGGQSYRA